MPTLLLLLAALLLPPPLAAQEDDGAEGMGTEYFECRETALTQYDICTNQADGWFAKLTCYVAWDLDNIGCDLDLIDNFLILAE
ncbi:MAG: hypothetical protein WEA24_14455 [Gemmatimonadota bacterium]